jgi:hypothetical protein
MLCGSLVYVTHQKFCSWRSFIIISGLNDRHSPALARLTTEGVAAMVETVLSPFAGKKLGCI